MLAMGILGLMATPRQEDPQISVPLVDIFLSYPGASAQQVADMAVNPLERIMSEIPGVKHVYSASARGEGVVTVRFKVGEKTGSSLVKVHDKLASNLDNMPSGVQMPPLVKVKGIDDVPVVTLTLWSSELDGGSLRRLGLNLLQEFKQIPDTGQGFVVGGQRDEIRVEILPNKLSGSNVTAEQVANVIRGANAENVVGNAEADNRNLRVYAGSFLRNARDVQNLVVGVNNGKPVYVRDVARVSHTMEEIDNYVNYYTGPAYAQVSGEEIVADGEQAITVAIAKKEGSNGVTVANAILEMADSLKGRLIPDQVRVEVTRNYGATAQDKVNELLFKLVVATGIVTLLVWWALGLKPAIVVTVVIPVVILMTVFAAFVMGFSIDRVSLFALIFSIGILVDDAIVVVENIYRRWLIAGSPDTNIAVDAVREVGNPTILATFTVVAALLPMAFVSGLMGPYMAPIPVLGSVAMMISLFAAFAFTSYLVMRIRPSMEKLKKAEEKEHASNEKLDKLFRKLIPALLDNKRLGWGFLIGLILIFFAVCGMFYTTAVTVKMLPFDNKPEFAVIIDMPEGTALPTTSNLARELAEELRKMPEVTALQTYTGSARPFDFNGMVRHYYLREKSWLAEIQVQLLDKKARKRTSHEIAETARATLTPIARAMGARITVAEMPPGPPVLQSVVAEIYGPDDKTRREVARHMTKLFDAAEGLADVDNYLIEPYQSWRFEISTRKASMQGITTNAVIQALSAAMGGYQITDVRAGSALESTWIVMQAPLSLRANPKALSDMPVAKPGGGSVPLAELGRFIKVEEEPIIYHKDLRPLEYVVGDAVGRLGAPIYPMIDIDEKLQDYKTPDGVTLSGTMTGPPSNTGMSAFEWGGEWTVTYETFRDMGAAFAVALVLIYMLVVGMFGNFTVPAIIMAPIPLTLLGIVPGHWLFGAQFTATSMIGFIALAGIIVRNSILLVDFAVEEVRQGHDVREAVLRSCKARTRPIMITAFALMGGASVIITDSIFQGMAIALMFGVFVSTVLTLIVIPMGCVKAAESLKEIAAARGD
ncbi:MAG: efflux RND transporter permease subunit [gamma proteobacterium endosymbiont of Lamellibrachia anaximandri]|nr:efflux RND transporter permease subunit [gamma proteobacterium endosymbiont of Lamellibrachia anaximandri]MBL3533881.1 efflux RND transporter permease subunit [gamma proteobacterium endosymbiont of Lamellibrachia anaximandri]